MRLSTHYAIWMTVTALVASVACSSPSPADDEVTTDEEPSTASGDAAGDETDEPKAPEDWDEGPEPQ